MTAIADSLEAVNRCQIAELQKAGTTLDPIADCNEFYNHIRNVQSAVIHTYQLKAYSAMRQDDPAEAAKIWKEMADFCDSALTVLRELKSKYMTCGARELYDLVLDYRCQAHKRYLQNLQDCECKTIPPGLFAPVK